jgi:hypothetical protein
MRERGQLRAQRNAAAQHRELQVGDAGGQLAQLLADLVGQFAGGAQHQRLRARGRGVDALQQAQAERRSLAAAGRRLRDHVAAVEDRRQGLRLDRGEEGVVEGVQTGIQEWVKRKFGEGGWRRHSAGL